MFWGGFQTEEGSQFYRSGGGWFQSSVIEGSGLMILRQTEWTERWMKEEQPKDEWMQRRWDRTALKVMRSSLNWIPKFLGNQKSHCHCHWQWQLSPLKTTEIIFFSVRIEQPRTCLQFLFCFRSQCHFCIQVNSPLSFCFPLHHIVLVVCKRKM